MEVTAPTPWNSMNSAVFFFTFPSLRHPAIVAAQSSTSEWKRCKAQDVKPQDGGMSTDSTVAWYDVIWCDMMWSCFSSESRQPQLGRSFRARNHHRNSSEILSMRCNAVQCGARVCFAGCNKRRQCAAMYSAKDTYRGRQPASRRLRNRFPSSALEATNH